MNVPGSFELTFGASLIANTTDVDAIITLGSVVQGETKHFDFICQGVSYGISQLNISLDIPVIFGLLTDNSMQQAIDRSGGKLGNKGADSAEAALKMIMINSK
jgi:6,7-dimethyl-8-ribityllumazine synthase